MSLAAIPAYFLARRLLPARLALVVAALTVLVPSMLYTGTLMTENAFYPLFLVVALAARRHARAADAGAAGRPARALRRRVRDARAGGRARRRGRDGAAAARARRAARLRARRCGRFALALRHASPAAVVVARARDRRARPLAADRCSAPTAPRPRAATRPAASSTSSSTTSAELDLYRRRAPVRGAARALARAARPTPAARAFAAGVARARRSGCCSRSRRSPRSYVDRIEERNMFYLAPLALIALLGLAADGVVPRPRRVAGRRGASPACCRSSSRSRASSRRARVSDTFALLPWWWAQDHRIHLDQVRWAALAVCARRAPRCSCCCRAGTRSSCRRSSPPTSCATAFVVENGRHGIHQRVRRLALGAGCTWRIRTGSTAPSAAMPRSRPLDGDDADAVPDLGERVLQPQRRHRVRPRRRRRPDPLPRDRRSRAAPTACCCHAADGRTVPVAQYVLADGSIDLAGTRRRAAIRSASTSTASTARPSC